MTPDERNKIIMTSIMELEERISRSIILQVEMSVKLTNMDAIAPHLWCTNNPDIDAGRERLVQQINQVGSWLEETIALLATARAGGSLAGY